MKKFFFWCCAAASGILVNAADFSVGGIGYNVLSDVTKTVQVADCTSASGDVVIPASVSSAGVDYAVCEIAQQAFYGSKITSVSIPETITKIGDNAFGSCTGLKSVKYNAENCATAGGSATSAFTGCSSIQSVSLGDGVQTIPPYIFQGLAGLRSIAIPNKVTSIGSNAFANCTGLSQIYFDAENCGTASDVFVGCTGSFDVVISDNVREVPSWLFNKVLGVKTLTIGKNVRKFGRSPFGGCRNLEEIRYNAIEASCDHGGQYGSYWYTFYSGSGEDSGKCGVQRLILGSDVRVIPASLMHYCEWLTSVTWNQKLEKIGAEAFESAAFGLFNAPASLKEIGTNAFPPSLVEVRLNEGLETLSGFGRTKITEISIPSTVKVIGASAFPYTLTKITGLESASIEEIGDNAFDECSKLKGELRLGANVKRVGQYAFRNCKGFSKLVLNDKLERIDNYAFKDCSGLQGGLELPNTLTYVGTHALAGCNISGKLVVPEGITSFGEAAFGWNAGVTGIEYNTISAGISNFNNNGIFAGIPVSEVTFGDKVRDIGEGIFGSMANLTTVNLPASVRTIGVEAFAHCSALSQILMPKELERIDRDAFYKCDALTEIEIPENVVVLGGAFNFCYHITKMVFNAKEAGSTSSYPFSGLGTLKHVVLGENVSRLKLNVLSSSNLELVEWKSRHMEQMSSGVSSEANCVAVVSPDVEVFYGCNFNTVISAAAVPPVITKPKVGAMAYVPDVAAYRENAEWDKYVLNQSVTWTGTTDGEKLGYETNFPYELTLKHYLDAEGNVMEDTPKEIGDYRAVFTYAIGDEVFELPSDFAIKANTTNTMFTDDVRAYRGRQVVIPVKMVNDRQITSFQFDLYLPQGMKLAEDEYGDPMIEFTSRKSNTHTIASSAHADGSVRIASFSSRNAPFTGNEGNLILLTVDVAQDAPDGEAVMSLRNIRMVEPDAYEIITNRNDSQVVISGMVEGDTNDDTFVTMADVVNVVNYVLGETPEVFVFDAADLNHDGEITMADAVAVMAIALAQDSPAPVAAKVAAEEETQPANRISIEPLSLVPGQTGTLYVNMDNEAQITSFQFDLLLPEGLSIPVDEEGEPMISLSAGRTTNTHMIASRYQPDGSLRIVAFSSKNRPFKGNSGAFVEVEVKADESLANGDYPVAFSTIYLIQPDSYQFAQTAFSDMVHVGTSGVASASASSGFSVSGVDGEIVVTASEATGVVVYDLSGAMVADRDIPAGETRFAVSPGFYVVNGHKVFVK